MKEESTGPEVVSLAAYRAARKTKKRDIPDEIVTDVRFAITRGGNIVPTSQLVAQLHVLAVLGWCLEVSTNMLDKYIGS
jgi:hypothetical protein